MVEQLVTLGVVEEITGARRNRVYRFAPYIRLFSDQANQEEPAAQPGRVQRTEAALQETAGIP